MGFFQDLKQDLSQTVTDLNVDETVNDLEQDADMSVASEDLFGNVDEGDFADLEAMLEKEAAALNDEPVVLSEEAVSDASTPEPESEDVLLSETELEDASLPEPENEDISQSETETEEVSLTETEEAPVPKEDMSAVENEVTIEEDIDMLSIDEENKEISEADAEMEELLNEVEQNMEEQTFMDNAPQEPQQDSESSVAASTDTAVITAGMNITGDVTSSGNMDLIGNITGNIDILGKLNVTGGITGNSSAAEIYAESAQINGEIRSKGSVKIGQSSVVIGNIFATSAVIAGAVKGDIDVHGPVILDTSAIVMGNIKSKSVQINNGAVIEGMCSQCYADVSPTSFFNDVKKNRKQQQQGS